MSESFKCAIIDKDVDGCEGCKNHPECLSMAEAMIKLNDQLIEDDEE